MAECALSFIDRAPIDVDLARRQHTAYVEALQRMGAAVIVLPAEPDLPDSVFVEDTAVVVNDLAVMTAPLLESRRKEVPTVAAALAPYRKQGGLSGEATLEGGDVMMVGRTLYVGLSARTNRQGVAQLAGLLEPLGYRVEAVRFRDCLHLKSACCYVGRNTLLANSAWIDTAQFGELDVVEVAPEEPTAANALWIDEQVLLPASFPRTAQRLRDRGIMVRPIDVSEVQKAEGGVTCCSILFETE